jgi:hypothetical protein
MEGFWITFTDGTSGYCEGLNAYDAARIAEKLTGKTAEVGPNRWRPELKRLPYPANPIIWQLDHPLSGKCPAFCISPEKCCGNTSCPRPYSCTE